MVDGRELARICEAIEANSESLWKMMRSMGLSELERVLRDMHDEQRHGLVGEDGQARRPVYGLPEFFMEYCTIDEVVDRDLRALLPRACPSNEAKIECAHAQLRTCSKLEPTENQYPTSAEVQSFTRIRRSALLFQLYNTLWHPLVPGRSPTDEALPWERVLDLLTWATEADVTLDPDQVLADCQALIIDVEKRVYAATVCRRANEVFHDQVIHHRIIGHILILFMFGFWDHALTLVERCFTYTDEAYEDFMRLLKYHFPKAKFTWDDVGSPTHPMRHEGRFQNFRLDVRKMFIDETRLRMNENHILRPIVTLLGCVPQLLRTEDVEEDPNMCKPGGGENISSSGTSEQEMPQAEYGFAEDVDDLISRVFQIYRELCHDDQSVTQHVTNLKCSYTISWFCCTLFWNRYSFISLIRESIVVPNVVASNCAMEELEDNACNEEDAEERPPVKRNYTWKDSNLVGYLYHLWATKKGLKTRLMPVSDVAFSLMIGNDLDHLLKFIDSRRELYLPTTAPLLALFCFFDFNIGISQLVHLLIRATPLLAHIVRGVYGKERGEERDEASSDELDEHKVEPAKEMVKEGVKELAKREWSTRLTAKLTEILSPFAGYFLLLTKLSPSDLDCIASCDWWIVAGGDALRSSSKGVTPWDPLTYAGLKYILNTMVSTKLDIGAQIRVHWLKTMITSVDDDHAKVFAYLELQKVMTEVATQWISENENKVENDVPPISPAFDTAREAIQQHNRFHTSLHKSSPMVQCFVNNDDLIEFAMSLLETPQVLDPVLLETIIFSLTVAAERPDVDKHRRTTIIKKAFATLLLTCRYRVKVDIEIIWTALHRLVTDVSLEASDVEQILTCYTEFMNYKDPLRVKLLQVKAARNLILNASEP